MPSLLKRKTDANKSHEKMKRLLQMCSALDRAVSTNGSADILGGCAPEVATKPYNSAHAGTITYTARSGEEKDR